MDTTPTIKDLAKLADDANKKEKAERHEQLQKNKKDRDDVANEIIALVKERLPEQTALGHLDVINIAMVGVAGFESYTLYHAFLDNIRTKEHDTLDLLNMIK